MYYIYLMRCILYKRSFVTLQTTLTRRCEKFRYKFLTMVCNSTSGTLYMYIYVYDIRTRIAHMFHPTARRHFPIRKSPDFGRSTREDPGPTTTVRRLDEL